MDVGNIVKYNYDGLDLLFEIINKEDKTLTLRGVEYRIITNCKEDKVEIINVDEARFRARRTRTNVIEKVQKILEERESKNLDENKIYTGKVLHIDADGNYLDLCMNCYKQLKIRANGVYVEETRQPEEIISLLKKFTPDILVITGHDSYTKGEDMDNIESYKNSKYYIETVKKAREYNNSKDSLIIIAGACQSYYEELIKAGANFGSSPNRIVIHALDPTFVAEKVAYTPVEKFLKVENSVSNTTAGLDGIGGLQTRGTLREITPDV